MQTQFSKITMDFLFENRLQNSKAWFEEHREQYTQFVISPMLSLVEELTPTLLEIDDKLLCSPKVGGSLSRIWRDARFSKDKSLFRDTMWCMFVRQKNMNLPEFFFVFSPESFFYGCGYYSAGAAAMASMRKMILANDKAFKTALSAYEKQTLFELDGDMYKKSRHPDMPANLQSWLDRKTIAFIHKSYDFDLLYSNRLAATVAEGFKVLAPIYKFLITAEERVE